MSSQNLKNLFESEMNYINALIDEKETEILELKHKKKTLQKDYKKTVEFNKTFGNLDFYTSGLKIDEEMTKLVSFMNKDNVKHQYEGISFEIWKSNDDKYFTLEYVNYPDVFMGWWSLTPPPNYPEDLKFYKNS